MEKDRTQTPEGMNGNEERNSALSIDRDAKINLVVNSPAGEEETEIDLGRVFRTMKERRRLFAWVTLLCLLVGICAPLVMYQTQKHLLTVTSMVTLNYNVEQMNEGTQELVTSPVTDLTAPDGTELDLNQIMSSYVLQRALNATELSQPITVSQLAGNLSVRKTLTEESSRQQEVLSAMVENKNNEMYNTMANLELKYTNTFAVSLRNGFGEEDSNALTELKDEELRLLLTAVLRAYNEYMVETYADRKLPEDLFSAIDLEALDIPEIADEIQTDFNNLLTYAQEQPETVRAYRSWQTGYTLDELIGEMKNLQRLDIEYLTAFVYNAGIARDRQTVLANKRYQKQLAETEYAQIQENIAALKALMETYRNDQIFVSSPETETYQTVQTNTRYYNELVLTQAKNEEAAAKKQQEIRMIQDRIDALTAAAGSREVTEANREITELIAKCEAFYARVAAHMQEILDSDFYNNYTVATAPIGKQQSFLAASARNMAIGAVAGLVIGCGIWFLGGLLPEFTRRKDEEKDGGEKA